MNNVKRTARRALALFLIAALCLSLVGTAFAADTAATVQLSKTKGTVTVTNGSNKKLSVRDDMRLYNSYHTKTARESYAWFTLDSAKLAKLDANSEMELRKSGKVLELLVNSGNLYFNVTEPLATDETLNIRTSNMITGIRGTCGWVQHISQWQSRVSLLAGSVVCSVTDPVSGQTKTTTLKGGEQADFWVFNTDVAGDKCDIVRKGFSRDDIPGSVLTEVAGNAEMCEKIYNESGIDLRDVTPADAAAQQARDEYSAGAQLDDISSAASDQANNVSTDPVWKDGSTSSGSSESGASSGGSSGGSGGATPPSTPSVWDELNGGATNVTATEDVVIPANTEMTIPAGKTLDLDGKDIIINDGATLKVGDGATIVAKDGTDIVVNNGATLQLADGATVLVGANEVDNTVSPVPGDTSKLTVENGATLEVTEGSTIMVGTGNNIDVKPGAVVNVDGTLEIGDDGSSTPFTNNGRINVTSGNTLHVYAPFIVSANAELNNFGYGRVIADLGITNSGRIVVSEMSQITTGTSKNPAATIMNENGGTVVLNGGEVFNSSHKDNELAITGGGVTYTPNSVVRTKSEDDTTNINAVVDAASAPASGFGVSSDPDSIGYYYLTLAYSGLTYSVTFNTNGGYWYTDYADYYTPWTFKAAQGQPLAEGTLVSEPTNPDPSLTFAGWYTEADGGTQVDLTENITENTTYYAHWKASVVVTQFTVTFQPVGGTWASGFEPSIKVTEDGTAAMPTKDNITRAGYKLAGWIDTATGVEYPVGGNFQNITADMVFAARWVETDPTTPVPKLTVTFIPNGGVWDGGSTASLSSEFEDGDTLVVPKTFARSGYEFTGWMVVGDDTLVLTQDASGNLLENGAAKVAQVTDNDALVLLAQWEEIVTVYSIQAGDFMVSRVDGAEIVVDAQNTPFEYEEPASGKDYGVLHIYDDGLRVTMADTLAHQSGNNTGYTADVISVEVNNNKTVTLEDVKIIATDDPSAVTVSQISASLTTNVKINGLCEVVGHYDGAGVELNGKGTMAISGSGVLEAIGGVDGAGIGGRANAQIGNISISDITVRVGSCEGAGIGTGCGYNAVAECGDITITNANVKAEALPMLVEDSDPKVSTDPTGANIGAGGGYIRSGVGNRCGNITIISSTVELQNDLPACIGSGLFCIVDPEPNTSPIIERIRTTCGDINISGRNSRIKVAGGIAGIGGNCGKITISDSADVEAFGSVGILSSGPRESTGIYINGATVNATGWCDAGIGLNAAGNGTGVNDASITINKAGGNSFVTAVGHGGAAIGALKDHDLDFPIDINYATVTATGYEGGAGIGAGANDEETHLGGMQYDQIKFGTNAYVTVAAYGGGAGVGHGKGGGAYVSGDPVVMNLSYPGPHVTVLNGGINGGLDPTGRSKNCTVNGMMKVIKNPYLVPEVPAGVSNPEELISDVTVTLSGAATVKAGGNENLSNANLIIDDGGVLTVADGGTLRILNMTLDNGSQMIDRGDVARPTSPMGGGENRNFVAVRGGSTLTLMSEESFDSNYTLVEDDSLLETINTPANLGVTTVTGSGIGIMSSSVNVDGLTMKNGTVRAVGENGGLHVNGAVDMDHSSVSMSNGGRFGIHGPSETYPSRSRMYNGSEIAVYSGGSFSIQNTNFDVYHGAVGAAPSVEPLQAREFNPDIYIQSGSMYEVSELQLYENATLTLHDNAFIQNGGKISVGSLAYEVHPTITSELIVGDDITGAQYDAIMEKILDENDLEDPGKYFAAVLNDEGGIEVLQTGCVTVRNAGMLMNNSGVHAASLPVEEIQVVPLAEKQMPSFENEGLFLDGGTLECNGTMKNSGVILLRNHADLNVNSRCGWLWNTEQIWVMESDIKVTGKLDMVGGRMYLMTNEWNDGSWDYENEKNSKLEVQSGDSETMMMTMSRDSRLFVGKGCELKLFVGKMQVDEGDYLHPTINVCEGGKVTVAGNGGAAISKLTFGDSNKTAAELGSPNVYLNCAGDLSVNSSGEVHFYADTMGMLGGNIDMGGTLGIHGGEVRLWAPDPIGDDYDYAGSMVVTEPGKVVLDGKGSAFFVDSGDVTVKGMIVVNHADAVFDLGNGYMEIMTHQPSGELHSGRVEVRNGKMNLNFYGLKDEEHSKLQVDAGGSANVGAVVLRWPDDYGIEQSWIDKHVNTASVDAVIAEITDPGKLNCPAFYKLVPDTTGHSSNGAVKTGLTDYNGQLVINVTNYYPTSDPSINR